MRFSRWELDRATPFPTALHSQSLLILLVQGVVCGIITTGDPVDIEHRQNMDALNFLSGPTFLHLLTPSYTVLHLLTCYQLLALADPSRLHPCPSP